MNIKNLKRFQFCLLALIFILISSSTFFLIQLDNLDELWNFQSVYKMYNGYKIYTDANVIITPLFFIIGNLLFKIFGATILTFRLYNIILLIAFYGLIFFIFKKLKINSYLSMLYTILVFINTMSVVFCSANYNSLAIIFVFLGIIVYLNYYDTKHYNILQSLIMFLIFFTKQNIVIYYFIALILFEFTELKISKIFFYNQIKKFFIFIILVFLSFLGFFINGNFFDFINYTFGGLFEFGNSNIKFNISIYPLFLYLYIIATIIYIYINKKLFLKNISKNDSKNLKFILIIAILMTFIIFPIINTAHLLYSLCFYLIPFFYYFNITIFNDILDPKKHDILINWICIILLFFIFLKLIFNYYNISNNYSRIKNTISPFYNILVENEYINKIDILSNYIIEKNKQNIDVIIIASDSAFTMVSINKNNNNFDLVFNGNLGFNGIDKMIEKIKNTKENTEFLIYTNECDMFWQESYEIRNYIINNLTKIDEICNYSIYKNMIN